MIYGSILVVPLLCVCLCRKQHSLWVQGDVHRSKQRLAQQRLSRQQQLQQESQERQQLHSPDSEGGMAETMSRLRSSMDDLSINTTLYKSYSLDEVRVGLSCILIEFGNLLLLSNANRH